MAAWSLEWVSRDGSPLKLSHTKTTLKHGTTCECERVTRLVNDSMTHVQRSRLYLRSVLTIPREGYSLMVHLSRQVLTKAELLEISINDGSPRPSADLNRVVEDVFAAEMAALRIALDQEQPSDLVAVVTEEFQYMLGLFESELAEEKERLRSEQAHMSPLFEKLAHLEGNIVFLQTQASLYQSALEALSKGDFEGLYDSESINETLQQLRAAL